MTERAPSKLWPPTDVPDQVNLTFYGLDDFEAKSGIFSDFTKYVFEVVVWISLCGSVGLCGVVTNAINLTVFIRQGILTESVTASLAGLAVADLCCTSFMFFHSINYAIWVYPPSNIPWDPLSVQYVASGWPRIMFTRMTCWITAYVALERSMCVVLPFKVKQLFTARRSIVIICCIFVFIIASYIPIFYTHRLIMIRDPVTNVTKLRMDLGKNADDVEHVTRHLNDIILPTMSLSIVIICTQLTITRLNATTKWRRKNANSGNVAGSKTGNELQTKAKNTHNEHGDSSEVQENSDAPDKPTTSSSTSTKEAKVVKMITLICIIFIICNSPCVIIFYTRILIPEIANGGRYNNLFYVIYSMDFLLETINSSINIVVYYKMSSKYKQEFRRLFGMKDES